MKIDVAKQIDNIISSNSLESHCFNMLSNYGASKRSSLVFHLEYRSSHMAAISLADQTYLITIQSINADTTNILSSKIDNVKNLEKMLL